MNVEDIPYNYVHCYATKEQCKNLEHCLRHNAAYMNEKERVNPQPYLHCITAAYILKVAQGETCAFFRNNNPLKFAKGMKSLFDNVPKGKYASVRSKVIKCFGERSFYYAQKGEILISPITQDKIISIFKEENLSVPEFDKYEFIPDW